MHSSDVVAVLLAGAGAAGLAWRRLTGGARGGGAFIAGISLAVGVASLSRGWFGAFDLAHVMHLSSLLCVVWSVVGWAVTSSGSRGDDERPAGFARSCFVGALIFGVVAAVLVVLVLNFSVLYRLASSGLSLRRLSPSGTLDLLALLAAVFAWRGAEREPHQPAMLLLLTAMLVTWVGLMIPAAGGAYGPVSVGSRAISPEWWSWMAHFQSSLALVVFGAMVFHDRAVRTQRERAWPDRLNLLIAPGPSWAGFAEAVAVLAAGVLLVGVYQIARGGPPGVLLTLTGAGSAAFAGYGCLNFAQRRWNSNLVGLGIGLLTLAAANLSVLPLSSLSDGEYGERTPIVLNAVLFSLAIMAFLWFWLSHFWRQQLLDGRPWTPAGRAVPYVGRAGFLVAALATLIAYQMAFWPQWRGVVTADDTAGRWVAGLAGCALLALVTGREARRAHSSATAGLSVAAVGAALVFALVRWDDPELRGPLLQYRAIAAGLAAMAVLAAAEALPATRWACFAPALWFLALLVLPVIALSSVVSPVRLPAEWVRPMTLAIVGAVYGVAGGREGRRAFLLLSGVLLVAAAVILVRVYLAGRA